MLIICSFLSLMAQQQVKSVEKKYPEPEKMTPGMTEIWDPEVKIIQPGV